MVLKKVLVTGGRGKIGQKLVSTLRADGWRVSIFDKAEGGIENKKVLRERLGGVEYVIHLAVYQNPDDKVYEKFRKINVEGTRNLLDSVDKKAIKKLIYFSSEVTEQEADRMDNYAKSKSEALGIVEGYLKKLPIAIVSPSVVIDKNINPPPAVWWQRWLWQLAGGFPGAWATLWGDEGRMIKIVMIDDLLKTVKEILVGRNLGKVKLNERKMNVIEYRELMKKVYR